MCRQPLQLPLQLLDLLLSRPFCAPTPTVRADVPASPASQGGGGGGGLERRVVHGVAKFAQGSRKDPARIPQGSRKEQEQELENEPEQQQEEQQQQDWEQENEQEQEPEQMQQVQQQQQQQWSMDSIMEAAMYKLVYGE